jgi:hypothetical protein
MKQFYIIIALIICMLPEITNAQTNTFPSTGNAGIGTVTPHASSALEISSTTQGLLVSRMTLAQRDAILSPATGLMIYQTNSTPGFYYYTGAAWTPVTAKNKGWSLTGNSGTTPATNFIGTTDAAPLMFKINNNKAGYIDFDAGKANTVFGYQTLYSNTSGFNNTANGYKALYSNTTGFNNVANGFKCLYFNTAGGNNIANGVEALYSNTTGRNNIADGLYALYYNSSGYSNVAIGASALFKNTTIGNLVAIGDSALFNNGAGATWNQAIFNTAVGSKALYSNTTGSRNTANGFRSLYMNTAGVLNTAIGSFALFSNTSGSVNIAIGPDALYKNVIGQYNSAIGDGALYENQGDFNTANGNSSLSANTWGNFNTGDGYAALGSNITGSYNTALGYNADVLDGNLTNSTAIGNLAWVNASNKVRIGNNSVTSIGGQVGWTTFSDARFKKNIKDDVRGLSFINSLRPITYTVDIKGLDEYFDKGRKHDSAFEKMKAALQPSADEASTIIYNGFVAQDVEAAAKKLNYDFSGVDKPKTKDGLYGLRYADFVVPLVKAVQELSKQNDELGIINDELKKKDEQQQTIIDDLESRLAKLETMVNSNPTIMSDHSSVNHQQVTTNLKPETAKLEQNIPNPFNHTTVINYVLPATFTNAQILVTDNAGKPIKAINISGNGKGNLTLDASTVASGTYHYSLYVNGKLIATKQMELLK